MIHYRCEECERFTAETDHCPHCHSVQKNRPCPPPKKLYILTCGCCGGYYESFNSDSEFDHDLGFGECAKCHGWITAKNEKEFDKIFTEIERGLSPRNCQKWSAFSRDKKKEVAMGLLDRGVISYCIGRS